MKAIVSAFYKEIEPIIKHYNLKKINSPFEIFKNDKLIVIISGIGKINSAIATTYILNNYKINFIINFGIAGSSTFKVGDMFLINKINKNLYPDIIYSHPFKETYIKCSDEIVTNGDINLVDMESEGFFKASTKFLPLENIFIIKIVSDNLVCFRPDSAFMNNLINPHIQNIIYFIESLKNPTKELFNKNYLENISEKYNLSFSQKEILKNRIIYFTLNQIQLPSIDFEATNRKKDFIKILEYFKIPL
jgi:hypothetical protein